MTFMEASVGLEPSSADRVTGRSPFVPKKPLRMKQRGARSLGEPRVLTAGELARVTARGLRPRPLPRT